MSTAMPQYIKDALLTDREREDKQDLGVELARHGLEDDLQILWDNGIRHWTHLSGMLYEQMRLPGLQGTFEQYVKMQEAQFKSGLTEDENESEEDD
jgi:hypothetical protein